MSNKILIVEDERIIAEDIRRTLLNFGYQVIDMVASGENAIASVERVTPDLVLMDINLDGKLTGVETAEEIYSIYNVPVVYLTAYADDKTLGKAKLTEPFGYILKPFEERELHATIEMAFYKHKMENALRLSEKFLRLVIDNDPNIIYVKDVNGIYLMVNRATSDFFETQPANIVGKTDAELAEMNYIDRAIADTLHHKDINFIKGSMNNVSTEESFTFNKNVHWYQISRLRLSQKKYNNCVLCVAANITEIKIAEEKLKESNLKLKRLLEETVNGLVSAVEMRDPYTAGHQRRVAKLACAIAEKMGFDENRIDGIRMAGLLHDIGKMYIPAEILTKPGILTDVEFNLIKIHPEAGRDILSKIEFPWPIADFVAQHHEVINGSGYPKGLSGDEISLEARILCVADVIESMSSHRPYRATLGIYTALKEITQNRGILYDSNVVDICLELFHENSFEFDGKT